VTAAGNGKTVDGLVQALMAPTKTNLDQQVSSGNLTSAQETSILNHLQARLTDLVNGKHGNAASTASVLKNAIRKATTIVHI